MKAVPSITEVIEHITDSKAFMEIPPEQAGQLIARGQIPVWLLFSNINSSFNSYKFQKYIEKILNRL
jgi:hypothetical protein